MADQTFHWVFPELDLGPFWTLPNFVSLLRLLVAVPVAYLIVIDGSFGWIFGLTAFAILTDWIDGHLARWSNSVSEWGKVIDPVSDKIAGGLVVGALVLQHQLPLWLVGLVLVRDALILLGGLAVTRRTGTVVMSTWLGKLAAAALAMTVVAALLEADPFVMTWSIRITAVLLVLSFVRYVIRFLKLVSESRTIDAPPNDRTAETSPSSTSAQEPKQEPTNSVASNGSS